MEALAWTLLAKAWFALPNLSSTLPKSSVSHR